MDYFDYRTFIGDVVREFCPDIIEHKDAFNRENIGSITSGSGFHILPTRIDHEVESSNCQIIKDEFTLDLQLLFCGGRYVSEALDTGLTKANCIRGKLIDQTQFPIDNTLERVEVTTTIPSGQESNDNTVLINMTIILHLNYCVEC